MAEAVPSTLSSPSPSSAAARANGLLRNLLRAHVCLFVAVLICWIVYRAWRSLLNYPNQTNTVLLTIILAGSCAVICLAGTMRFLDQPLCQDPQPRWFVRLPLKLYKRVVLLFQLALTAVVIGGLSVWVFGFKMPQPT